MTLTRHSSYLKHSFNSISIYHTQGACWNLPEHSHDELQVVIPIAQSTFEAKWHTAGGRKLRRRVNPDQVSVIPSTQPHAINWQRGTELIIIHLHPTLVARAAHELIAADSVEIVEQYTAQDLLIQQLGLALRRELQQGDSPESLYIESLTNVLIVHLLREYSAKERSLQAVQGGLSRQKLQQAIAYIERNLERNLTLAEISTAIEMSQYHFARLFKQSTGLAPHQYVINCRIERAKQLLANKELPIVEICRQVGFSSQSYFTTVFCKLTGFTPNTYRKRI